MATNVVVAMLERLHERLDRIEAQQDPVLGVEDAAALTGYSKQTLYNKVNAHLIPHYKRDGRLFFRRSELVDWLLEYRVPTQQEIERQAVNHGGNR